MEKTYSVRNNNIYSLYMYYIYSTCLIVFVLINILMKEIFDLRSRNLQTTKFNF